MRDFDSLDTNSFKAFWAASETLNFTVAAKTAGLTQSGVSQHISRLEKQLGVPLFERIKKKVFLTEAGKMLRTYVDQYLDQVELFREKVKSESVSLSGLISYAMPASCLMSPHFSLLLKKRLSDFPELKLDVSLCPSEEVIEKLLNSEIQFGFITKKIAHPGVKLIPFCPETYVLVSSDKKVLKDISVKTVRTLPFVKHPGVETLFEHWRQHYFPKAQSLDWETLTIVGRTNSLAGAIQMVEGGVGLTIMPEHCVQSQIKAGTIHQFLGVGGNHASNQIFIAVLNSSQLPRRVYKIIEVFLEMVKNKN